MSYAEMKNSFGISDEDVSFFKQDPEIIEVMKRFTGYDFKFENEDSDGIAAINIAGMIQLMGVDASVQRLKKMNRKDRAYIRCLCRIRGYQRIYK